MKPPIGGNVQVVGVGGAGSNAVSRLRRTVASSVRLLAANTDSQALEEHPFEERLILGPWSARGRGAGGRPAAGFAAAEETLSEISGVVSDADLVFVAAGMGGGTGTGAAPVIAHVAREQGALTLGVVTTPFSFEGGRRARVAKDGLTAIRDVVDTLLVLPNDRLLAEANADTTLVDAFHRSDQVLGDAVTGICDLVARPGLINLDFADLRRVFEAGGRAVMGLGEGAGKNRALDAITSAMESPLLSSDGIDGAQRLLLSFTVDARLSLSRIQAAAEHAHGFVDPDAEVFFGVTVDPTLEDEVRVTLVATGLSFELADRPDTSGAYHCASEPPPAHIAGASAGQLRNALVML